MTAAGWPLDGSRRMELLAAIAEHGSITRAAQAIGMSYKGAWDAVAALNNLAGAPLVERAVGGKGGGSARLTPRGAQLLAHFTRLDAAHRAFTTQLGEAANDLLLLQRMQMRTSARNQFLGTVTAIQPGAVNDEVSLSLAGGHTIVATITRESTATLGLTPGATAYALVKASSIVLLAGHGEGVQLSARNQLRGTVARVLPGAVNTDVTLALDGGLSVAAIVTGAGAKALGLRKGAPATAVFKASSVILGVPG